jgi:crotonobetainyl-CoA:carnitine CoA-transferase CaiB-like acyl-CoA transferase
MRDQTGVGQRVDSSLLDTALGLLNYQAENCLLTGEVPRKLGSAHPSLAPYRNFRCGDGEWIFVAGANDRLWRRLAGAIGIAEAAEDPRFATNLERVKHRDEVDRLVGDAIARIPRAELLRRLGEAEVPAAPVNTVDQLLADPQTAGRPAMRRMHHPRLGEIPVVGMPLAFSGMDPDVRRHSPAKGEHTDEVLGQCGYSPAAIKDLRRRRVVA